jgi:uncharacterized lipoprotein YddW (UPF0748 family)
MLLNFFLCALLLFTLPADSLAGPQPCFLVAQLQQPGVLSSRSEISKLINYAEKKKVSVIFVQVYRANQAWFPSRLADSEPYKTCFKNISADPFNLLVKKAHAQGIKIYAWVNLLSLSNNQDAFILKKYGVDILTRNLKEKKKLDDYKIDRQYFLEPGDPQVRKELLAIVEEIIRAYPDLDGVLLDYLRYPDERPDYGYTKINIQRFQETTGAKQVEGSSLAWQDWKRTQVNELLSLIAKRVRSLKPGLRVGATGCAPYIRAYYEAYQDWPAWVNSGLVDFVLLMSYPDNLPEFNADIQEAKEKVKDFRKVYIGLPAYKLLHSPGTFAKQLQTARISGAGGWAVFHYNSLLESLELMDRL